MDRPLTACRSTTVEEGQPETYSPGESSRKVKDGQDKVKTRSRQGQDKVKTRSRQGQDKVKTRSRQGQDKVKTRSRQPLPTTCHFSFAFFFAFSGEETFSSHFLGEAIPPWLPSRTRKLLLTFFSKSSRQMRTCQSHSRSSEPGFEQLLT